MRDGANSALRPQDLENLEIEVDGETENKRVRVGDIAEVLETQSLSTIHRASQRRLVTVSFGIAEGYSAHLVSDAFAPITVRPKSRNSGLLRNSVSTWAGWPGSRPAR